MVLALLGRAELLQAWRLCRGDKQQLLETLELFGYQASPAYVEKVLRDLLLVDERDTAAESGESSEVKPTPPSLKSPKPLPQVAYYTLLKRERYASEAEAQQDLPPIFEGVVPLSDAELEGWWSQQEPISPRPLTHSQRMTPVIRQRLQQAVGERLAVKKLVRQMARRQPLRELPTEPRLLPAGRVTVVADLNDRLLPFWQDISDFCELIRQKHGKVGLDMRVLAEDEPLKDFYRFDEWQQRNLNPLPWQKIPAQSQVVILSDVGQLSPAGSLIRRNWLHFLRQLNRRGITPLVFSPIVATQQCPRVLAYSRQFLWQRFGRLQQQKGSGDQQFHQQQVERVLGFLALSPHIEPELLRALCELLPVTEGQSGVEASVYRHPQVQWSHTAIALDNEARNHYQQQFKQENPVLQQQVLALIRRHHSAQFPIVWAETVLNAEPWGMVGAAEVQRADEFMLRFAATFYGSADHDGMARLARRHLGRLSLSQRSAKDYATAIKVLADRKEIAAGQALPEEYDSRIASQILRELAERQHYYLNQIGSQLMLCQQPPARGQCLAEFDTVQDSFWVNGERISLTPTPLPEGVVKDKDKPLPNPPLIKGGSLTPLRTNSWDKRFVSSLDKGRPGGVALRLSLLLCLFMKSAPR